MRSNLEIRYRRQGLVNTPSCLLPGTSAPTPCRETAHALCAYVERDACDLDPPFVDDLDEPLGVIELGSGTGFVAAHIARTIRRAAKTGSLVIATDLPDVCPLLQHNLGVNSASRGHSDADPRTLCVRPLAWGNLDHIAAIASEFGFDHFRRLTRIVCSDLASTLVRADALTRLWLTITLHAFRRYTLRSSLARFYGRSYISRRHLVYRRHACPP